MAVTRGSFRQVGVALRALGIFTVVLGIGYTFVITGFAQLVFPAQANGSLAKVDGTTVGSSLIGQSFATSKGVALPKWFQARPSAASYNGGASSGSNYGPNDPRLIAQIRSELATIEKSDGVSAAQIPADALTASGSGLDPDISPAYALIQVDRIATARGLSVAAVKALVESKIQGRELGYLGEPTVNVLELNIALAKL